MTDHARPGRSWNLDELAAVAGESPEQLRWYADAGMLHLEAPDVFAPDSPQRLRLIRHAHRRGITDEDLAVAIKEQGDLLGVFDELVPGDVTRQSLLDAADAADIPTRLRDVLLDTLGIDEDDPATTDDLAALEILSQALQLGLPEDALIQMVRVFTDTMSRLADAEVRIFHDYVHEQFRAQGLTGPELLGATESVSKPALGLVEPAVLYFHRRAFQKSNRDDMLRHLAEATTPPQRPGEAIVTVMFVDLAGFTPLTVALGDSGVAEVLQRFASTIRREADNAAGRIIKQIGDAFMLVFDRPDDAVAFGLTVMSACEDDPDLPLLHVGAHHGPLLYRDGDYYGNAVNLAARVTSASDAGQFLVTEDLADAAGAVGATLEPIPQRPLKGVAEPPNLLEVHR